MLSPRRVTHYHLCGIVDFPWHRHHIEGTNGFSFLIRKTQRYTISNVECQVFTHNIYHARSGDRTQIAGMPSGRVKATVTPDRTISGSNDWLRLGQGATDRQCLLRSPAAVTYRDRSLCVVALSRTIGEYQWQEPS